MSRIGKKEILIPEKTAVSFNAGVLSVKGPQGELSRTFRPEIEIKIEGSKITLNPKFKNIETNALWGTYASHIQNMVAGVNTPYEKKLIVEGVGFRSEVKGMDMNFVLGFSHPVKIAIPKGLKVTAEKNVVTVSGADKEVVGEFAARIRSLKKPEPYKGTGIRYNGEVIRRKQGKKSV